MLQQSFGRAFFAQFHPKMWLLSIVPTIVSLIVWGIILKLTLSHLTLWLQSLIGAHDFPGWVLAALSIFNTYLAPLLAMWLMLTILMLTTMALVGTVLMPFITRFVAARDFPELEQKKGGSLMGGIVNTLRCFGLFVLMWLVCLPLAFVPVLGFVLYSILWGWLTYRTMAYDALAEHASLEEMDLIFRQHRWPLLAIGSIACLAGSIPGGLWLSGVLTVVLLPITATVSIWLFLLIFIFAALWFQYYLLAALQALRQAKAKAVHATVQIER
jgi:hypothetical protein